MVGLLYGESSHYQYSNESLFISGGKLNYAIVGLEQAFKGISRSSSVF